MNIKSAILIISIGIYSNATNASEFRWKLLNGAESKIVGDEEYKFLAGDWTCVISALAVDKTSKSETRRLGCSLDGGLEVFVNPSCGLHIVTKEKVKFDSASFDLQQKKQGSRSVLWSCSK